MEWVGIGGGDKHAVVEDGKAYTIFTARSDGTLEIRGPKWKECPLEANKPCRRQGLVRVPEKCKVCSYNPVCGHWGDQRTAVKMAEAIHLFSTNEVKSGIEKDRRQDTDVRPRGRRSSRAGL